MSDPDRLAEIKVRREAATPGPWWDSPVRAAPGHHTIRGGPGEWRGFDGSLGGDTRPIARIEPALGEDGTPTTNHDADAEFIAHAPADIDWLAGEIERLRDWQDRIRQDRTTVSIHYGKIEADRNRLRDLLARLEWSGGTYCDESCCPECGAIWHDPKEGPIPHRDGCELAAALQRRDPPDSPPPA